MDARSVRLWVRWSWRDLRRRWLLVTALALTIALGTGVYAGLGGTTAWRIQSNDASYSSLRMHDLRVRLPEGGFVPDGTLLTAVDGLDDAASVEAAVERLVVPTLVDASTGSHELLVPGELVGMPTGTSAVDSLYVAEGRGLRVGDEQQPVAVLESKFATGHDLPAQGRLLLGAEQPVDYVGTGYTPEYFQVIGRSGMVLGERGFAVVFMPLAPAQAASGHAGQVNDLVLRAAPGADLALLDDQLADAVAPYGGVVTTAEDDPVRRALYEDAHNDQKTWNVFAFLILFGAAFAAFNLVTRMIESQRREIGVGMALGVPPRVLAVRPLLVGVQIAVLGVVAGIGVGWLTGQAMAGVMTDLLPLPVWQTPFQAGRFAQAALLGLLIPLVAAVLPIARALRMSPVDAIRSGAYGAARPGGRLLRLVTRARLPGKTYVSMSLRNVLRAGRRTAFTALGVAAAVTSLVAAFGLMDTFSAAGGANAAEVSRSNPDRLLVTLDTFHPVGSALPRAVADTPGVADSEPQLGVPATFSTDAGELDAFVQVLDFDNDVWTPSLLDERGPADGLVLSEKAADDLGVAPGDSIAVRHLVRVDGGLRLVTSQVPVRALHPNPWRTFAYLDADGAALFGLAGTANQVVVVPSGDVDQLRRDLFELPGVTAIESASSLADALDNALEEFTGILRVIEVATLLLALLIAFNTASISADERTREHATMFAFGLPPRVVMTMAVVENALIGVLGTLLGIVGGFAGLSYIVSGFDQVMPDLAVEPTLSATTVVTTFVLGVLVVGLAPLLGVRRERRMDIPAALRVVE
ncbi:FtsX-like permease family protein [Nocardioides taihuensis]|uniref:FtsX-like permease family protein n=1 Tax=Nocardioides taihuensis TaxID=1835606 RepID=A0ABW0BDH0_9ACTN